VLGASAGAGSLLRDRFDLSGTPPPSRPQRTQRTLLLDVLAAALEVPLLKSTPQALPGSLARDVELQKKLGFARTGGNAVALMAGAVLLLSTRLSSSACAGRRQPVCPSRLKLSQYVAASYQV
jgi:hypothetical protein